MTKVYWANVCEKVKDYVHTSILAITARVNDVGGGSPVLASEYAISAIASQRAGWANALKAAYSVGFALLLGCAMPTIGFGQASPRLPFSFTLSSAATTSAGVFAPDGTLVRTLWSNVPHQAGAHAANWDGLDDEGNLATDGRYHVKVVSSNVKYEWEGVVGNTSQAKTGSTVNRAAQAITGMVVVGNYAYYAVGYTEGEACSYQKFDVNNPQVRLKIHEIDGQSTCYVASDGTYVYWGGPTDATTGFVAATNVADDKDIVFPSGTNIKTGHNTYSAIDVASNSIISGMAVQQRGNFLFVAHINDNLVRVLDKKTGAVVGSWSVTKPRQLALVGEDALWLIHDTNTVEKFTVSASGTGTASGMVLANLPAPTALAVSPDARTLTVIDGSLDNQVASGGNHQVKSFSTLNGQPSWTLGQAGGYATDPAVGEDKFCFINTKFETSHYGQAQPYLAYQPDGSFWIGDVGNLRSQHFSASRSYLNQIAYLGYFYSCAVDPNNPQRVFANYLEFAVDYSRPLAPNNGSWRLIRNWSMGRQAGFDDDFNRMQCVTTLGNGRTYALLLNKKTYRRHLVELPPSGNLRYTGIETPSAAYQLYTDGSLWNIGDNRLGQPAVWKKQILTGFDGSNNPQWGSEQVMATTQPLTLADPVTVDGFLRRNQVTSTGVVVAFCNDRPRTPSSRGVGYHLGGVQVGTNKWLWKTSPSTTLDYQGDYPSDGAYDIGNGVEYAGSFAQALDRSIFWGYNGEFWKNGQTNKWNHYLDNGLMVGQFGVVRRSDIRMEEAPYGLGSNAVTGTFVKVGQDYYLYHCDEGFHAGVHRWKISGLNTIREQTVDTLTVTGKQGLLMQQFVGDNLDNVFIASSTLAEVVQSPDPKNSARWTGFVKPLTSQKYVFYTRVTKRVRLWVNDKMVVNEWRNNSLSEFSSDTVAMEAGKRYAIKLEVSGGDVALSWMGASLPKQAIGKASYFSAVMPDTISGIPLNEGVLFNASLENGLYGWSRDPATDIYDPANPTQWERWRVRSNVMTVNKKAPDVNVQLNPMGPNMTVSTSRNLTASTGDFNSWTLSGKVVYPAGDFDKRGETSYLQVLDERGLVIARINREEVSWPSDYRLYFNGKMVAQSDVTTLQPLNKQFQDFKIKAVSTGLTFQYGDFPAISTTIFDPASNWKRPKTLQVLFYSPGQNEHEINLSNLRLVTSAALPVPSVAADYNQNTLSASTSLRTADIVVSENGRTYSPYTGSIAVGNTARSTGYWKFRLQDVVSRQYGDAVPSPAFTTSTGTLPVTLVAFQAKKSGAQVVLNWKTANEVGISSYEVEKGTDGQHFAMVGAVPGGLASGSYSLVDKSGVQGTVYYRLRIIDSKTGASYGPVAAVSDEAPELFIAPNPVQSSLQVQYPQSINGYLEISTVTGQKVRRVAAAPGTTATSLDVQALLPGMYYLLYYNANTIAKQLFVKY
jgi:hypothetical protein